MPDSDQGSSSGGGRCVLGSIRLQFRIPHRLILLRICGDAWAYFDTDSFDKLPSPRTALNDPYCSGVLDNEAEAWRKRWKHWGRYDALQLKMA